MNQSDYALTNESEANFQLKIIQLSRLGGWELVHAERKVQVGDSSRWITPIQGDPGFPDLVLVHRERRKVLFVEIKKKGGQLPPEEYEWGLALLEAGQDYRLWSPSDWDEIVNTLGVEVF